MADAPPEGFKNYLMIMTPEGRLIAPASCWVYDVNVFTQSDVERAVRDGDRLNNVARRYGGEDLAPRLVAPALADEIAALNTKIERRRARLVEAETDLLDIRGLLSPSGEDRKVPMPLVPRVAPAVEWLLGDVERIRARAEQAEAERDRIREQLAEALQRRDAYSAALHEIVGALSEIQGMVKLARAGALDRFGQDPWEYIGNLIDGKVAPAHELMGEALYGGQWLIKQRRLIRRADNAEAERDQLKAVVERVRELHARVNTKYGKACDHCRGSDEEPMAWPCPTIAALDQPKETGQADQDPLTAQVERAGRLIALTAERGPVEAARIVFGGDTTQPDDQPKDT